MLNKFRQGGVIQVLMGGVILMIIAAFALEARGPGGGGLEAECAVQVGDSCVHPRDFTAAYQMSVRPELTAKEIRRLGIRKMLLDGLVERELLLQEAERLGVGISSEKVDAELALGRFHFSLPAERDGQLPMLTYVPVRHPETNAFSFEIYQRMVRNYARMSTKDFKAYQTDELVASRMRDLSKLGARVSEAEVYAAFESESAKATVRVAQLDNDWFARFTTALGDDAVREYIAAHTAEIDTAFATEEASWADGCPLVSEIFFAFPPAADAEDEQATRSLAERVAAQAARAPASFPLLARMHSAAPSASHGGQRGCLVAAEGDEEAAQLVKAVEGLAPGALSALIPSARGVHLLRLERRVPKAEAAELARLSIARPLAALEAAQAQTTAFAEALKERVAKGATLQEAVDALSREALNASPLRQGLAARAAQELESAALESRERPQVDVSPSFARGGVTNPVPNAVAAAAARQLAFTLKAPGEVHPEPIATYDGLALMQLKELEPAKREEFEKNKAEYLREYRARAESEALTAFVSRLRKEHEGEIQINQRFIEAPASAADDS